MSFELIAGLGNPGKRYDGTRHNVGFEVLDAYADRFRGEWNESRKFEALTCQINHPTKGNLLLVKPLTYVNESGKSLSAITRYFQIKTENIVVIHDDLNLDFGRVKISTSGSAGGHNGLSSIISHLDSEFTRFRVGIGPKTHSEMELKDFVLGKFLPEERTFLEKQILVYANWLNLLVDRGAEVAMTYINRKKNTNESS